MQVLKPEIRKKILNNAEKLFYERGFQETSTRSIANKVDISVSNLYNYFDTKQDIFAAVVEPFYQNTKNTLISLFGEEDDENKDIIDMITAQIIRMIIKDRRKFVILMGRSKGTKYANFRNEVIEMLAEHMYDNINHNLLKDDFILQVFASNFFAGILKIAEKSSGEIMFITGNVSALVKYHMAGIAQFY